MKTLRERARQALDRTPGIVSQGVLDGAMAALAPLLDEAEREIAGLTRVIAHARASFDDPHDLAARTKLGEALDERDGFPSGGDK